MKGLLGKILQKNVKNIYKKELDRKSMEKIVDLLTEIKIISQNKIVSPSQKAIAVIDALQDIKSRALIESMSQEGEIQKEVEELYQELEPLDGSSNDGINVNEEFMRNMLLEDGFAR